MSYAATAWAYIRWPFAQAWGFLVNLWTWLTENLHPRDIVLPSIYESYLWFRDQLPLAFGTGSPGSQIEASFVLAVASFLTGFVTGFAAWALIALWAATALIGLFRMVPFVDKYWPLET